jgi:hypothetical protein
MNFMEVIIEMAQKNSSYKAILGVCLLLAMLLIPSVSATDWTKSIEYNETDVREVTFKDWWDLPLISGTQGTAELKSHELDSKGEIVTLQTGLGEQVVMYYDFNFKELITDGLGDVEFINLKTGKPIERDYKYVYWFKENRTRDVCLEYEIIDNSTKTFESKNETAEPKCLKEGTETYTFSEWRDYKSRDIPTSARIGVMVNNKQGDYIDGIWNLGSKKLDKHAEWNSSLETDLISWYKLDETSGINAEDSHGSNDGTANDARVFTTEVDGIINTN